MALLINIGLPEWMTDEALREHLKPQLPGIEIYCGQPERPLPDVVMLATSQMPPGTASMLPNLSLVQKLGAGVEKIVNDPDLPPRVVVTRLAPSIQGREIAEYFLAYVMRGQRNMGSHEAGAAQGLWQPIPPKTTTGTTIGVLGMGHIGSYTARLFASLGFRVLGWSRSAKSIEGVECRSGREALEGVLAESDYVACILPSTPATHGLFDSALLASMKPSAVLMNAGRGDLIVEGALIDALDSGSLAGAVLDVFLEEPLPEGHPFWRHPRVTVTPHVSGWHLDDSWDDVAENYLRLRDGRPLLHRVDRTAGY